MAKKATPEDDIYERDKSGNIIGEKPEARLKVGHHTGPRRQYGSPGTGYELAGDGAYHIAPCDQQAYEAIQSNIDAIHELIRGVMDYANKELTQLIERRSRWFRDMAANLYREQDVELMIYQTHIGKVIFEPPKEPKPDEAGKNQNPGGGEAA